MRTVLGSLAFLLATSAGAADPSAVGFVKNVEGEAAVTTAGKTEPAAVGTAVFPGSILRTGPKGRMGVTFKDETVMSFGPGTELTVDEYLYAPAQGKLKIASRLGKGSLNYVSGVIAKLQPDAVTVKTPTGMIGVRGTQFLVRVED